MKLIDSEMLVKSINEIGKGDIFSKLNTAEVLRLIYTQPIVMGSIAEWKVCSDGYYPYCSNCGKEPKGGMSRYCPNCGSKMGN